MKLRVQNLMKSYSGRKVVKDVSFEVNQGEIVGLLGPNGAGKTTSFYMTVGLIKPNGGAIYLDDTEITSYPMYKRAQSGIGYLAQEASVFRKLSIEDNILSVLQMTKLSKKEQIKKTILRQGHFTNRLKKTFYGHFMNRFLKKMNECSFSVTDRYIDLKICLSSK